MVGSALFPLEDRKTNITNFDQTSRPVHVGIVGAGIGGLAAAIAISQAGAQVTVLEAAEELGEVCPHHWIMTDSKLIQVTHQIRSEQEFR